MKKKLLDVLKTLYADKGLNAKELDELADILANNLKDDSTDAEINNVANGASLYVGLMQKHGNRSASAIEEKYKGYVKPDLTKPTPPAPPQPNGSQGGETLTQEAIAKLISSGIAEALKPFQQQREEERLAGVLSKSDKLKGIPAKFVSRYKLEKEDDLDAITSQIAQDYAEEKKAILDAMGIAEPPTAGGKGETDEDFAKLMQSAQKALEVKD